MVLLQVVDELAAIFTGEPVPESTQTSTNTVIETEGQMPGEAGPSRLDNDPSAAGCPAADLEVALNESAPDTDYLSLDAPDISSLSLQPSFPTRSHTSTTHSPLSGPIAFSSSLQHSLFTIKQLGVDNRLIVNRKRQLKMHRVWMQGKFLKLSPQHDMDSPAA